MVSTYTLDEGLYTPVYKTFVVPKEYTQVYKGISEYTSKLSGSACKLLYVLVDLTNTETVVEINPKVQELLERRMSVDIKRIKRLIREIQKKTPLLDSYDGYKVVFNPEYFCRQSPQTRKQLLHDKFKRDGQQRKKRSS